MIRKPKRSFRTLLIVWFIVFSVVPVSFVTGYSLVRFEAAIDQELSRRLIANTREIESLIREFEFDLANEVRSHSADKSFVYYLSNNNLTNCREILSRWMSAGLAKNISVYNRNGRLELSMDRDAVGEISRNKIREKKEAVLSTEVLQKLRSLGEAQNLEVVQKGKSARLELVISRGIKSAGGIIVGFIQESLILDSAFLEQLKKRLGIELFLFASKSQSIVATRDDLSLSKASYFEQFMTDDPPILFELTLKEVPHQFSITEFSWGDSNFFLGLGASKKQTQAVLSNVNYAFFSVLITIIILLVLLSLITSKIILRPLNSILDGLERIQSSPVQVELPEDNVTEFGQLSTSFNTMSRKIFEAQSQLKSKITELEIANKEIQNTQERLVHTAKMASLGQLVAGVAHELNNPIGFIYSNMTHLRDYSEKLTQFILELKEESRSFSLLSEKYEFEFIKGDLPKLISSCEEGARRTRDIVLGLRNFSRLENAQMQDFDLHKNLDETLGLLSGELKDRIVIEKNYELTTPTIKAFSNQLSQVFMNILSNASQAIQGTGKIRINTLSLNDGRVEIQISDNGTGMNESTISQIFDPFFTTKSVGEGTGLGLSISYGIIEKHGGQILVESKEGEGTTFRIQLPFSGHSEWQQ